MIDLIFNISHPILPGILPKISKIKIGCPGGINLDYLEANYYKRNDIQNFFLTYSEDDNITKARYQVPHQYIVNVSFTKSYKKAL